MAVIAGRLHFAYLFLYLLHRNILSIWFHWICKYRCVECQLSLPLPFGLGSMNIIKLGSVKERFVSSFLIHLCFGQKGQIYDS